MWWGRGSSGELSPKGLDGALKPRRGEAGISLVRRSITQEEREARKRCSRSSLEGSVTRGSLVCGRTTAERSQKRQCPGDLNFKKQCSFLYARSSQALFLKMTEDSKEPLFYVY